MWAAARPFLYDPTTGIATQIARLAGAIYSDTNVGATGQGPGGGLYYDDAATIVYHSGDVLYFWGWRVTPLGCQPRGADGAYRRVRFACGRK
jgi:hypothetical protein